MLGLSAAGEVFGMQTTVVNPPAAAARAPDSIVSFQPNPGSRRCTWMSIRPGATMRPVASMISALDSLDRSADAIPPSTMKRSAISSRLFAGSMMRPLRMSRVHGVGDPSAEIKNGHAHGETVGDLVENDALHAVGDFAVDFDAAIDRARMHDQAIGLQQFRARFR